MELPSGRVRMETDVPAEPARETDVVPSCILVRKETFEAVGGFFEPYFFGYEDSEFCLRAKRRGFRVACVCSARAYHHIPAGGREAELRLIGRVRLIMRNRPVFVRRNCPPRGCLLAFLLFYQPTLLSAVLRNLADLTSNNRHLDRRTSVCNKLPANSRPKAIFLRLRNTALLSMGLLIVLRLPDPQYAQARAPEGHARRKLGGIKVFRKRLWRLNGLMDHSAAPPPGLPPHREVSLRGMCRRSAAQPELGGAPRTHTFGRGLRRKGTSLIWPSASRPPRPSSPPFNLALVEYNGEQGYRDE